jgi:hypothetical protein
LGAFGHSGLCQKGGNLPNLAPDSIHEVVRNHPFHRDNWLAIAIFGRALAEFV